VDFIILILLISSFFGVLRWDSNNTKLLDYFIGRNLESLAGSALLVTQGLRGRQMSTEVVGGVWTVLI